MSMDPIADMLSRVRNALLARHEQVEIPFSNIKEAIARILERKGYVEAARVTERETKLIQLDLKYHEQKPSICSIRRVSSQGRRRYSGYQDIPHVFNGLGISVVSTSKGIMTDQEAREQRVGGEILCEVW